MRERLSQEKKRPQSAADTNLQSRSMDTEPHWKRQRRQKDDLGGNVQSIEPPCSLSNECAARELKCQLLQAMQVERTNTAEGEAGPQVVSSTPAREGNWREGLICEDPSLKSSDIRPEEARHGSGSDSAVAASNVAPRRKWEEDVDLFWEKMRSRLSACRELDQRTLITQGVDSGVGCRNREAWWGRYYREKFHLEIDEEVAPFALRVANEYILGLQWVLLYYYQGCRSYDWFFPFHYAPLALDLSNAVSYINAKGRRDGDQQSQGRHGETLLDEQDLYTASVGLLQLLLNAQKGSISQNPHH